MSSAQKCTEVQQVLSAAFDAHVPDPTALENAKTHCRTCTECAGFVHLLAELRRLPAPELPDGLLDRTLEAIEAEMDSAEVVTATVPVAAEETEGFAPAAHASPADAPADAGRETKTSASPGTSPRPGTPSAEAQRRWQPWVPWAAAAALFFVAAGVVTAQGVRFLMSPTPDTTTLSDATTAELFGDGLQDGPAESATPERSDPADAGTPSEPSSQPGVLSGPAYATLSGEAYRYESEIELPSDAVPTGTLTTALDSASPATQREFYQVPGAQEIIVDGDDGRYLRLTPVTRSFRGREYVMRSQAITTFGVWPTLPEGIPRPSSPEGTPELVPVGSDDIGVQVYARPGTDPVSGFAVPPGTAGSDPANGNPEWTWWEPSQR